MNELALFAGSGGGILGEVRPELVNLENSLLLVGRGLALVLGDLAEMGYDAQWCIGSLTTPHLFHALSTIS
jgi:hypothetical protein